MRVTLKTFVKFSRSFRMSSSSVPFRFIDIGVNLTDPMYQGEYNDSKKHEPDLDDVLDRSRRHGLQKLIITGGTLEDSKKALDLARQKDFLYTTVGCHPTRCQEFLKGGSNEEESANQYVADLSELIEANRDKVVAVGECGLDYDRLNFCDKETQLKYFERQLDIAAATKLPLFLHCRNAASDLAEILSRHADRLTGGGVVHSFDGTWDEAKSFLDLGYLIGINGCSLKTESNLEVVKQIPSDKICLETDAPWCEIRPTHAGSKFVRTKFSEYPSVKRDKWKKGAMVKSRNEPCGITQVFEVVSAIRNEEDPAAFCETIYNNTLKLFYNTSS